MAFILQHLLGFSCLLFLIPSAPALFAIEPKVKKSLASSQIYVVQLMTNKFSILTPREGARQVRKDLSLSANWGSHNAVRVLLKIQSKPRQIIRLNNISAIHLILEILQMGSSDRDELNKLFSVKEGLKVLPMEICISFSTLYNYEIFF